VASRFDCLGLGVASVGDLDDLVERALPRAFPVGEPEHPGMFRWQDASGARILFELEDDGIHGLVTSYAGAPGARLAQVWLANEETAYADAVDEDGETLTRFAIELEQRLLLRGTTAPAGGAASVVALGVDVRAHAGPAAFEASDDSLLAGPGEETDSTEPAGEIGREPVRLAAESLISYGLFGDPADSQPFARVSGTVLTVTPKRVALTGGRFTVARVRTVGMEVDLCLPGDQRDLTVGGVVSGTVLLVGSLPHLER
jgi:hypothetical protein